MIKTWTQLHQVHDGVNSRTTGTYEQRPNEFNKSFITEVDRLNSSTSCISKSSDARTPEGATEVLQYVDKMVEKKQRSRRIRTMMQIKTFFDLQRNALQDAETVKICFDEREVTELPRSVQLDQISTKVVRCCTFASSKKRSMFETIFFDSREIDTLLKDMFWYITAHTFQSGRQPELEAPFYQRIANSFTSLFLRLQSKFSIRAAGFFDCLPDVMAQILFMALYEAFPRSRKIILSDENRREILRTCYCWIKGFVPTDLTFSHWVPVNDDIPTRIAELANFPAMRNRIIRAERIERTRHAIKTWHDYQEDQASMSNKLVTNTANASATFLPCLPHPKSRRDFALSRLPSTCKAPARPACRNDKSHDSTHRAAHLETHERCTYEMCNSPLISAFLAQHDLKANTSRLRVQMRLTCGRRLDLHEQEAFHFAVGVVPTRRRRLVYPKTLGDALTTLETSGNGLRHTNSISKEQLCSNGRRRHAEDPFALPIYLSQSGKRMDECKELVSTMHIDALLRLPLSGKGEDVLTMKAGAESTAPLLARNIRSVTPRPHLHSGGNLEVVAPAITET